MAVLGAGTKVFLDTSATETPTWLQVKGIKTMGDTGEEAPLVDVTTIDVTSKEYIAGILDGAEKEITGNLELTDPGQDAFIIKAKARAQAKIKIEFPTTPVTICTMTLQMLGFHIPQPEMEQALQFKTKGKVTGGVTWTEGT